MEIVDFSRARSDIKKLPTHIKVKLLVWSKSVAKRWLKECEAYEGLPRRAS